MFVHGLTDHPGRHFSTARALAAAGFTTLAVELAGHGGKTVECRRSRPVYEAYAEESDLLIQSWAFRQGLIPGLPDLHPGRYASLRDTRFRNHVWQVEKVLQVIASQPDWRRLPVFLMGFSMGGLIVTDVALAGAAARYGLNLRGLVLLSPAFKPKGRPGNRVENWFIDRLWDQRVGPLPWVRPVAQGVLDLNFPLDCQWGAPYMSDIPEEVEVYRADPLVLQAIPSAYASSIEARMAEVDSCAGEIPAETLFLFPSRDGITSLPGGLTFASRVRAADPGRCTIHQFETPAHDLRRSSLRNQVLDRMSSWLLAKA